MTGSVALDVVIGLLFVYLLYSLFATVVSEIIATNLGFRARNLLAAIDRMLTDQKSFGEKVCEKIENKTLSDFSKWTLDSKIVEFLVDLATKIKFMIFPWKSGLTAKFFDSPEIKYQGKNAIFKTPSYLTKESFSKALLDILKSNSNNPEGSTFTDLAKIQNYLRSNNDTDPISHSYIQSLLDDAQNDLEKFKVLLENWFERMMDRAKGWYKRQIQLVLLIIGFITAVAFNASTFKIIEILANDKDARAQMVQLGSAYIEAHKGDSSKPEEDLSKILEKQIGHDLENANSVLGIGWYLNKTVEIHCKTRKSCLKNSSDSKQPNAACCNTTISQVVSDTLFLKQDTVKCDSIRSRNCKTKKMESKRGDCCQLMDYYIVIPKKVERALFIKYLDSATLHSVKQIRQTANKKEPVALEARFDRTAYIEEVVYRDILGYLLTALAISLGAPFWFDLLNKVVQLRGSGQPVTTTQASEKKNVDSASILNRVG